MNNKSFIDLLFILLLGTFVLLSESLQVGALETAPADVGGGGAELRDPGSARVVIVDEATVFLLDKPMDDLDQLADEIGPDDYVLLTPRRDDVVHQRVMDVWAGLHERGVEVKLGVEPADIPGGVSGDVPGSVPGGGEG
ncbi:MAG: hypothetical protein AAFX76_07375 [Planctomycetota bacterium]